MFDFYYNLTAQLNITAGCGDAAALLTGAVPEVTLLCAALFF